MSFRILVDGEQAFEVDEQITRVSIMTSRGVAAEVGIADEGVIDIQLTRVAPGGVRRLDQVERERIKEDQERAKEGEPVGSAPSEAPRDLNANQFGGTSYPPPSVDLASDIDPSDSDTLTRRIEAYGSHGDAQRAIDEVKSGNSSETSNGDSSGDTGPETPTGPEGPSQAAFDQGTSVGSETPTDKSDTSTQAEDDFNLGLSADAGSSGSRPPAL